MLNKSMDYTKDARRWGGLYYACGVGGALMGKGVGPLTCYSPVSSWQDHVETTHQSHELRASTPDDWRVRGIVGAFWGELDIQEDMNLPCQAVPSFNPAKPLLYPQGLQVCTAHRISPPR